MSRLVYHSLTLRALYAGAMANAFLRYRNPRRRAADRHRVAFYERAWRQAAEELGGTLRPVGGGVSEICVEGLRTRVIENTSAIDDPVTLAVLADKALTHRILAGVAVPTPRNVVFTLRTIDIASASTLR